MEGEDQTRQPKTEGGDRVDDTEAKTELGENTQEEYINVKVVGQDKSEVMFKVKRSTAMRKVKMAYCNRYGISPNSVRFLIDGQRISDNSTPKQLELEDGDIIEVFQEQDGGAPSVSL